WFDDPARLIENWQFDDVTLTYAEVNARISGNRRPVIAQSVLDQGVVDGVVSFTLPAGTFVDPNAGDTLSISARLADGSPLPGWLTFDAAAGTFSGTMPGSFGLELPVVLTAVDSQGLSASESFSFFRSVTLTGTEGDDVLT